MEIPQWKLTGPQKMFFEHNKQRPCQYSLKCCNTVTYIHTYTILTRIKSVHHSAA